MHLKLKIPPTWTSRTALRWPARSCRSCHSSCTSLCRGTQWRGRCGTPPSRSLGRPEPDQNPLHLHWCAEGEIDYREKNQNCSLKVVVKWEAALRSETPSAARLLPSWRKSRSTGLPSWQGTLGSGWSDCGLQSPSLELHIQHTYTGKTDTYDVEQLLFKVHSSDLCLIYDFAFVKSWNTAH